MDERNSEIYLRDRHARKKTSKMNGGRERRQGSRSQRKSRFKSDLQNLERVLVEAGMELVLKANDFCTWSREEGFSHTGNPPKLSVITTTIVGYTLYPKPFTSHRVYGYTEP